MAGRKLRRQRQALLDALTDEQATAIARDALTRLNDSQVLAIIASGPAGNLPTTMAEARATIARHATANPEQARLVLTLCSHHPSVEQAIGLTRTPGQQHNR